MEKTFEGWNTAKQVNILTDATIYIMGYFILHNTLLISNRYSSWINKLTKGLAYEKNLVYKIHLEQNNSERQRAVPQIQDQLRPTIVNIKLKYYQKL